MTTPPTINAQERDVLYQSIVVRLTGLNDVLAAIEVEDFDVAQRLSGEFSDYLRLLYEDLGWGNHGKAVELSTPPDVLLRALTRLRERAEIENRDEEEERIELAEHGRRNQLLRDTCAQLLAKLSQGDPAGPVI